MNARDIIIAIVDALRSDAALTQWCVERYGRPVTVGVGWSEDAVPKDGWTYPACNIALWELSISESGRMAELDLAVEAVVLPPETTPRYEGALLADDLLCLCRDAIARAKLGTEISATTEGGRTEFVPCYVARGKITINGLRSHRAGLGR